MNANVMTENQQFLSLQDRKIIGKFHDYAFICVVIYCRKA